MPEAIDVITEETEVSTTELATVLGVSSLRTIGDMEKAATAMRAVAALILPMVPMARVISDPFPCCYPGVTWPTCIFGNDPGMADLPSTSDPAEVAQAKRACHSHAPLLRSFPRRHVIVNSHIPRPFRQNSTKATDI